MKIVDKEYYRKKAPSGYVYLGYWDGLLHYTKSICLYDGRYKALKTAKQGILFEDILEKNFVKRKKGIFKSDNEIALFSKTTKYQTTSCTIEQVENGDLEFMAKHGLTYQP